MPSPLKFDATKERSATQIVGAAVELYRAYALLFATLALGVVAPLSLIVLAANGGTPLGYGGSAGGGLLSLFVDFVVLGPLISALHIHAVAKIANGEQPVTGAIARQGLAVLPVVAAAAIMSGLGIALGVVCLIVPGVLLTLRWVVATQAAAVYDDGWHNALKRSRTLTRGNYSHIFGLLVITTVVLGIPTGVLGALLGTDTSLVTVLVEIAAKTLSQSFSALALAILFFDLGARHGSPVPGGDPPNLSIDDIERLSR